MKKVFLACAASLLCVGSAFAATPTSGEYGNHCAYGLTTGKAVKTDCSINWKSTDGKTYCFSSQSAKESWAKDTTGNIKKADAQYSTIAKGSTGTSTETTEHSNM